MGELKIDTLLEQLLNKAKLQSVGVFLHPH
jgi:hypothetical protein